jgi:hypothetical protein
MARPGSTFLSIEKWDMAPSRKRATSCAVFTGFATGICTQLGQSSAGFGNRPWLQIPEASPILVFDLVVVSDLVVVLEMVVMLDLVVVSDLVIPAAMQATRSHSHKNGYFTTVAQSV